ncbi:hypothetical protein MASR1M60_05290 [Rhodocyclaceae bacterium]
MEKKQLQDIYLNALADYKTEIDSDGDVRFRHPELGSFYISMDAEDDPEFFRMVFPNFADNNSLEGLEKDEMIVVANEVNSRNKAVKMTVKYMQHDNTWNVSAQVEAFIAAPNAAPDPALVKATMKRYISAIKAGVVAYAQAIKDLKGAGDSGSI